MAAKEQLTREEALLAFNDRLGQKVEVALRAEVGDPNCTSVILNERGVLHHWHEDPDLARAWAFKGRDDVVGLYQVGNTMLDITALSAVQVLVDDEEHYGLVFQLADAVALEVRWLKSEEVA